MSDEPTEQEKAEQEVAAEAEQKRLRAIAAEQAQTQRSATAPETAVTPPTDWEPPSEEEVEAMQAAGFGLIDGCFRPRSRISIVA